MTLVWGLRAQRDLHELIAYIAEDSLQAATLVAARILRSAELLMDVPQAGRSGRVAGTRELVVLRTPYLLVYRTTERASGQPALTEQRQLFIRASTTTAEPDRRSEQTECWSQV